MSKISYSLLSGRSDLHITSFQNWRLGTKTRSTQPGTYRVLLSFTLPSVRRASGQLHLPDRCGPSWWTPTGCRAAWLIWAPDNQKVWHAAGWRSSTSDCADTGPDSWATAARTASCRSRRISANSTCLPSARPCRTTRSALSKKKLLSHL